MAIVDGFAKRAPSNSTRIWNHLVYGWEFEAMAPIEWRLQSVGAPSPFEDFRNGTDWDQTDIQSTTLSFTSYLAGDGGNPPHPPLILFWFDCFDSPILDPDHNPCTVLLRMQLQAAVFNGWFGWQSKLRPNPFEDWTFAMKGISGLATDFPNPVTLTPVEGLLS